MTTAVSATAARSASTSRLRRASEVVLVAGTVLAVLAAFGPTWVTRAGVGVAVAAAVVGCVCAWRELFNTERRHARATLESSQRHGTQLREERRRNAEVVDTLTDRVRETAAVVDVHRVTIAGLRNDIDTLEGDRATLRTAVADRDRSLGSLRTTVQKQERHISHLESQLAELERRPDDAAEVHHMPRRHQMPGGSEHEDSAVLDLRTLETLRAILPNYEEDRRFG